MSVGFTLLLAGITAITLLAVWFYLKRLKAVRMLRLRDEAGKTSSKQMEQKLALYKKALALFPENLNTLYEFSTSCIKAKQIDEAEVLVLRGMELSKKKQDKRWFSSFQVIFADIHFLRGDLEAAENICDEVLIQAESLPETAEVPKRGINARWYLSPAQWPSYVLTFLRLIRFGETPEDGWVFGHLKRDCAEVIEKLAYKYKDSGRFAPAKKNFLTVLDIAEKQSNPTRLGIAYEGLGDISFKEAKFTDAAKFYKKSLAISSKSGNQIGKAIVLGRLGNVYYKSGSYKEAEDHLTQAMDLKKTLGFQDAGDLNNLALVYKATGDFEKATQYAVEGLEYYKSKNNEGGIANSLLLLGGIALKSKVFDQALSYYEEARSLIEKAGDRYKLAAVIGNLGLVAKEQKSYDKAYAYLKEALKISHEDGYEEFTANQLAYLGELAAEQSMSGPACAFWRESREVYLRIGLHHKVSEVENSMHKAGC